MKKAIYDVVIETPDVVVDKRILTTASSSQDDLRKQVEEQFPNSEISIKKKFSVIPAITFLSIAWILTLVPYYNGFNSISLFPNVKSLLCGLAIYSAFVIRIKGIENTFSTVPNTLVSILFILILSTYTKVFFSDLQLESGVVANFFSKIGLGNSYLLIGIAILLSWLGMKNICRYVCLAVLILGVVELCSIDEYMKSGLAIIFLLSSFIGLIFFFKYEDEIVFNQFKSIGNKGSEFVLQIKEDGKKAGKYLVNRSELKKQTKLLETQGKSEEKTEVVSENKTPRKKTSTKNVEN